jgi:hypothetical protein
MLSVVETSGLLNDGQVRSDKERQEKHFAPAQCSLLSTYPCQIFRLRCHSAGAQYDNKELIINNYKKTPNGAWRFAVDI